MSLHIGTLEQSFDLVAPRGDELVDSFYRRVLTMAPHLAPLFAGTDLTDQKKKLLTTLVLLRKSLRNLDAIVPALESLGARHERYGVRPEHYPIVGAALLETMAEIGGPAWQPGYTVAWTDAYEIVQEAMLRGAVAQRAA